MYHKVTVRRGFSILLLLIFALGPLATLAPASEDAALPACCRRDGRHHCAMESRMMAAGTMTAPDAPPIVTAPPHCPYYPQNSTVRTTPVHALTVSTAGVSLFLVQAHAPLAGRAAPILNPVSALAGRGPPSFFLA